MIEIKRLKVTSKEELNPTIQMKFLNNNVRASSFITLTQDFL